MSTAALQTAHQLDPDTQAVLLLCGWFGIPAVGAAPLSIAEYNTLALWLQRQELRPGDLLGGDWQRHEGLPLSGGRLRSLLGRGVALALAVENWTNQGFWILSRSDPAYPRQLKARLGRLAPPILYGTAADKERIPTGGLAIVGSRAADPIAVDYTAAVATACAEQGIAVISGGARGVDATAMEAALAAGGTVVGMLADGLARAAASKRYRRALIDGQLTLLSPFNPQAGFNAGNAMARNKYIYALADWALVVSSATNEGGTWAGATEALQGHRAVFARPGEDVPEGNRRLLQLGALAFPAAPWTDLAHRLSSAVERETSVEDLDISGSRDGATPLAGGQGAAQLSLLPGPADAAPATVTQIRAPREEHPGTTPATPENVFEAVWPLLAAQLQEPRTAQALAALLEVRPAQLQDWLDRGVREGRLCKKARPLRYIMQPSLFPECGKSGAPASPR